MRHPNTISLLLLLSLSLFAFLLSLFHLTNHPPPPLSPSRPPLSSSPDSNTSVRHVIFGISSSARSFSSRHRYIRAWWNPRLPLRGFVFLDAPVTGPYADLLPPLRLSSPIPLNTPRKVRSAVRLARAVSDLVTAADGEGILDSARWVVFGDDDTVFFPENLAATLGKYDWRRWWYVGAPSEDASQNEADSFDMAFGGGGFALSLPLAKVLARVMDGCLLRYGHLYGGDARVFSCLAELGVTLTREPGFHQVDLRGSLFGILSAHPLTPILSLHHLDYVDPLFPRMTRVESIQHLFKAAEIDPRRVLQQSVCYDRRRSRTISISWGFSVQVFDENRLLPELLSWQHTFTPWRRGRNAVTNSRYMHNTREFPKDPCKQPVIFFLESVMMGSSGIWSNYSRPDGANSDCPRRSASLLNLSLIRVFSQKFDFDSEELKAPRRHCCDIESSPSTERMSTVHLRRCKGEEMIAMRP